MMNIFAGLEKFGLKPAEKVEIFEEEKVKQQKSAEPQVKKVEQPDEKDFILAKSIRCPVCDKVFKTKVVKSGRVKRLEPEKDLRPHHLYIDTLKYDVSSCPNCGYTALNRYFEHISPVHIKMIKEKICSNYKPGMLEDAECYSYDKAVDMHKLSLFNAIAKQAKTSEKAYNCLIIAWLLREQQKDLAAAAEPDQEKIEACRQEEEAFYQQAYEGFMKAVSTEMFPIAGMDSNTMDYLLAGMSIHFGKYDVASKCLANIITSSVASNKMKDRARMLKDEVLAALKQQR